jgi:hypothetical protein
MTDDDRHDEGSGRLPFDDGADDDLFVWDGLRPPPRAFVVSVVVGHAQSPYAGGRVRT